MDQEEIDKTPASATSYNIKESDKKTLLDYMETENGHEIAKQLLQMLSEIKTAATTAITEEKKINLQAELHYKKFQSIIQLSVFSIGLIVVAVLTFLGKFESGVATLIGTLVGYFFGKNKNA